METRDHSKKRGLTEKPYDYKNLKLKKMKKLLCISMFLITSYLAKADELAWLSKDQAEMAVNFFKKHGIKKAIFWCACCDGERPRKIAITKVYYRNTASKEYYEVVIEGKDEKGSLVKEAVDLAYVHVPSGVKANCLGKELGFECSPCTASFLWPK